MQILVSGILKTQTVSPRPSKINDHLHQVKISLNSSIPKSNASKQSKQLKLIRCIYNIKLKYKKLRKTWSTLKQDNKSTRMCITDPLLIDRYNMEKSTQITKAQAWLKPSKNLRWYRSC